MNILPPPKLRYESLPARIVDVLQLAPGVQLVHLANGDMVILVTDPATRKRASEVGDNLLR